jgi:2-methylcitrate dehydratase
MDRTSDAIVTFVTELTADRLRRPAVEAATARLVDSIGCAVAAIDSDPARIARRLAAGSTGPLPATAIGLESPTTAELAAFANSVMVRYLDCNDMYFTARGGGGHPSDLIPAALAVGEAARSTGAEVLRSIALGYEVNGALATAVWLRERGWDQGLNVVAAAAMMAGALLGLSRKQLGHALALAVTPNVAVRQTRVGHLSMWKGCATAGAVRNGIFAALLAREGMTGPPKPYEGSSGIWEQVTGPFEIRLPVTDGALVVEDVATKTRPAEYNAQGPLDLILDLRPEVRLDAIEAIEVDTYHLTYHEIGSDPAKWVPTSRETADHSLAYLLAVALIDGKIDVDSCSPERIGDPAIAPLMQRISIRERPDLTARFPAELPNEIRVRLRDGVVVARAGSLPLGHPRNPNSRALLDAKFEQLVATRPTPDREIALAVRAVVWSLWDAPDLDATLPPLGRLSTSAAGASDSGRPLVAHA